MKKTMIVFFVTLLSYTSSQGATDGAPEMGFLSFIGQKADADDVKFPTIDEYLAWEFHGTLIKNLSKYNSAMDDQWITDHADGFTSVGRQKIYDQLNALNDSLDGYIAGKGYQLTEADHDIVEAFMKSKLVVMKIDMGTAPRALWSINPMTKQARKVIHQNGLGVVYAFVYDFTADGKGAYVQSIIACGNVGDEDVTNCLMNQNDQAKPLKVSDSKKEEKSKGKKGDKSESQPDDNGQKIQDVLKTALGQRPAATTANGQPIIIVVDNHNSNTANGGDGGNATADAKNENKNYSKGGGGSSDGDGSSANDGVFHMKLYNPNAQANSQQSSVYSPYSPYAQSSSQNQGSSYSLAEQRNDALEQAKLDKIDRTTRQIKGIAVADLVVDLFGLGVGTFNAVRSQQTYQNTLNLGTGTLQQVVPVVPVVPGSAADFRNGL